MSQPDSKSICADCGHEYGDSRFHLEAPGTNWGAALHHFREVVAPAQAAPARHHPKNCWCKGKGGYIGGDGCAVSAHPCPGVPVEAQAAPAQPQKVLIIDDEVEAEAPRGEHEKFCTFCAASDHLGANHKSIPGPQPIPRYCEYCGVRVEGSAGGAIYRPTHGEGCPKLEARGDQPIDIEPAAILMARDWWLTWSQDMKAKAGIPINVDQWIPIEFAVSFYRHMQSKTQPNREG